MKVKLTPKLKYLNILLNINVQKCTLVSNNINKIMDS